MIIYSHNDSPRLRYIIDFIANEWQTDSLSITCSVDEFQKHIGPKINYSNARQSANELWIQPASLLFETGIMEQSIECFDNYGIKAFFKTNGDFPFDVFAASFYLISRYEEYLPHKKDSYGRYAHENSLAYKEGFLQLPVVNSWLKSLNAILNEKFSGSAFTSDQSRFNFLPTYDIDSAWSYKHKGFWRNTGGLLLSFIKGKWGLVAERISVLRGKRKDPFDAFGWMNQLHEKNNLRPYYFFLVPDKRGRYDKNISPSNKAMQALIRDSVIRYPIGVHPSWQSGDDKLLLQKEIKTLSTLNGNPVLSSRQHYIRFNLPEGYRRLIECGIKYDFSIGYGSINGFRASVASPFYWYDIEKEEKTDLLLFPFCYMEANSFYEQKFSPEQALEEMRHFYKEVKSVKGYFIMIWHNSFLGTDKQFIDWRDVYEKFIKETAGN